MNNEILELAKFAEINESAEAQAVKDYTEFLQKIYASELEEEDKEIIANTIKEIVSDELNHQSKLKALYIALTSIQENNN